MLIVTQALMTRASYGASILQKKTAYTNTIINLLAALLTNPQNEEQPLKTNPICLLVSFC